MLPRRHARHRFLPRGRSSEQSEFKGSRASAALIEDATAHRSRSCNEFGLTFGSHADFDAEEFASVDRGGLDDRAINPPNTDRDAWVSGIHNCREVGSPGECVNST